MNVFANLILVQLYFSKVANGDMFGNLCNRIYFDHPSEKVFPYVNILNGVYLKTNRSKNGAPVYVNERGKVYFSYSHSKQMFYFSMDSTSESRYIGVRVRVPIVMLTYLRKWTPSTIFHQQRTLRTVFRNFYFERFPRGIGYLRSSSKSKSANIIPKCVGFSDCGSNSLIFTLHVTRDHNNSLINDLHINPFIPLLNTFNNHRRVYKHSNLGWYLYSIDKYWIIGTRYLSGIRFFAQSTAQKPELVTTNWYLWTKKTARNTGASVQCKGFETQTCSQLNCRNNGKCNINSFNHSFCTCQFDFGGPKCNRKLSKCNSSLAYSHMIANFEYGSVTTQYGKSSSSITTRQLLCSRCNNKKLAWYDGKCNKALRLPTTMQPISFTTSHVTSSKTSKTTSMTTRKTTFSTIHKTHEPNKSATTTTILHQPINIDESQALSIFIKIFVVLVPLLLPILHYCCLNIYRKRSRKDMSSISSLCTVYANIGFYAWLLFIVIYEAVDLTKYGPSTFNHIFVIACIFPGLSSLYMWLESLFFAAKHAQIFKNNSKNDDDGDAFAFIQQIQRTKPVITTHMECYHMETRSRLIVDCGTYHSNTEEYDEKVVTWTGIDTFVFEYWKDVSNQSPMSICLPKSIIQVNLSNEISFANVQTKNAFQRQQKQFRQRNQHRDVRYSLSTKKSIPDFKENIVWCDKNVPYWFNEWCFWLATMFCCTWPYRIALKTGKRTFAISKIISITPITEIDPSLTGVIGTIPPPINLSRFTQPPLSYTSQVLHASSFSNDSFSQEVDDSGSHDVTTNNTQLRVIDPDLPTYEDIAMTFSAPPSYSDAIEMNTVRT